MGSLSMPEEMPDTVTRPPELSDAEYVSAVLHQPASRTEDELDAELLAAAQELGIDIPAPNSPATAPSTPRDGPISSGSTDTATVTRARSSHARNDSSASSDGSGTTAVHSTASSPSALADSMAPGERSTLSRKRSRGLSFSLYDKYLAQLGPSPTQPPFPLSHSPSSSSFSRSGSSETASVSAEGTRRGMKMLKRGLSHRLRRHFGRRQTAPGHLEGCGTTTTTARGSTSCVCCCEDFAYSAGTGGGGGHHQKKQKKTPLHTLPCGHTYCQACLAVMIAQAAADESKMPPRCCAQPVPGSVVRRVLLASPSPSSSSSPSSRRQQQQRGGGGGSEQQHHHQQQQQQAFLKAVLQYSTPWEARIFCPKAGCGEFIPPRGSGAGAGTRDGGRHHQHPFEVTCRACGTGVCVTCRGGGHRPGQDCPDDGALDAVLRMGERSGWRRCYKCRTLVELTQGCSHMTCRCRAQFCYICGAAWDPAVGCPNYCSGEEELERRRAEEERREAEAAAEKTAREEAAAAKERESAAAGRRTAESDEVAALRRTQRAQMDEFGRFEAGTRSVMWARHSQKRLAVAQRHADQADKTRERHAKTEQHLEDRQIEAEIELRSALEQSEKSIRIQLKYMEAYCNGPQFPEREVTWKHREQLARQYQLRDGMERRHQSQINVLREKQAKRMEELAERHEKELAALAERGTEEMEDLGLEFANEEEVRVRVFAERRESMVRRWVVEGEILRRALEKRDTVRYGAVPLPEWPAQADGAEGVEALPPLKEGESPSDEVKIDRLQV